ncbi:hypothetical protein MTO96_043940, partial [Rhipicephalus appendiculatus]
MTTVVDFAIDRGSTVTSAVNIVPLFSITDTVGRLGLPVLADRGYIRRSTLAMLELYTHGGQHARAAFFIVLHKHAGGVYVHSNVSRAAVFPLYPALMAEYVGIERLPIGYGIVGTVAGPLYLFNPLFI